MTQHHVPYSYRFTCFPAPAAQGCRSVPITMHGTGLAPHAARTNTPRHVKVDCTARAKGACTLSSATPVHRTAPPAPPPPLTAIRACRLCRPVVAMRRAETPVVFRSVTQPVPAARECTKGSLATDSSRELPTLLPLRCASAPHFVLVLYYAVLSAPHTHTAAASWLTADGAQRTYNTTSHTRLPATKRVRGSGCESCAT